MAVTADPLCDLHAEWAYGTLQEEIRCIPLPIAIAKAWQMLANERTVSVRITTSTPENMARYRDELTLEPGKAQSQAIPRDPKVEAEITRILKEELRRYEAETREQAK